MNVTELTGIGPERAAQLERLGIRTLGDLLLHAPRKYDDRRNARKIGDISELGPAVTSGTVLEKGVKKYRRGMKAVFQMVLDDGTGHLHCRWWNMPWMEKNFAPGMRLSVVGKVKDLRPRTMDHPEVEVLEEEEDPTEAGRIVPVYPLTEGMTQRWLRGLVRHVLTESDLVIEEPFAPELLPGRPSQAEALRMLHLPAELHEPARARERLALNEFIALQKTMLTRRRNLQVKAPRLICTGDNRHVKKFLDRLEFQLTGAQKKVLTEIRSDLGAGVPMRRLLQGDVGSGKTVVAALTALMVIECGLNVVLMAPTEILAEQHYRNFQNWFGALGIEVNLRTGAVKTGQGGAEESLFAVAERGAITVGTHALVQGSFKVPRLGLVIIDEQHRFGVAQREELVRKGLYPHLLVMTATPIPRTLGLTLYGDLDISLLDELPQGRKPIRTYVRTTESLAKVWEFIRSKLKEGQQAYIVYARVEHDPEGELKAVLKEAEKLKEVFASYRIAALHGRVRAAEKEEIMREFRANRVQVLVASSLIEVGVDVPNATVMVIENAEQFGLAQLHQLRGRIGRGARESYCILVSDAKNEEAAERLGILEKSADGFEIAEADLKFRGPGELLGQQQSGMPPLKFGNLQTDLPLVRQARSVAAEILRAEKSG